MFSPFFAGVGGRAKGIALRCHDENYFLNREGHLDLRDDKSMFCPLRNDKSMFAPCRRVKGW